MSLDLDTARILDTAARVPEPDHAAAAAARARQEVLTKPAGSLGRLEALSIQVAGTTLSLIYI